MPITAARATIVVAFGANGSAQKTPKRTRSDPISKARRERRSTSGAASRPTSNVGRMSAISSALIHNGECVRFSTSIWSATSASHVPNPEPSVARKSERKPGSRPRSPSRRPVTWRLTAPETVTGCRRPERGVFWTSRFWWCARRRRLPAARTAYPAVATVPRTRSSASPRKAFSSAVPTVTRIAVGPPKPCVGRAITPSRRSCSKSGRESSPTSQ